MKHSRLRFKAVFWPSLAPRFTSLFNCAIFCILNTLLISYIDSQKWLNAMTFKKHAFKAAFIKNFIKGFTTFSFAFCSSFSLSCKSEPSTQRHSLKIHHTSPATNYMNFQIQEINKPRILSHKFVP